MRYMLMFFLLFSFSGTRAQLSESKWHGVLNVPYPMPCHMIFSKDTVVLAAEENGSVIETMGYHVKNDTLYLVKLDGGSPCSSEMEASYRYKISDEKLMLFVINDDCEERIAAFPQTGLARIKD